LLHGRVECALFYGTATDPSALGTMAGVPVQASAGYDSLKHELINVSLVGDSTTVLTSGLNYNVAVKCRDADYTGDASPQWQVAQGNLTALASQ
jgi:hypothetical protein